MTTHVKRATWRKRAIARGVTLFEVMIVVAILAMVAGGVAVFALPKFKEAQIKTAKSAAGEIRKAVQMWQMNNKETTCPTMTQLMQEKQLDPGQDTKDPWGQAYDMTCSDDDVTVSSMGPDKKKGTKDDINVPAGAAAPAEEP
jgi:general secretion pathway protein G